MDLVLERGWPETDAAYLRRVGYRVTRGPSATVDAIVREPRSGVIVARGR